ncbi:MAG: transporter, partial [Porphyromonadaceae bacterium]
MLKFLKDWTLPVSIALGTLCYLIFYYVPALDTAACMFGPVFDVIFPFFVFLTLLVTFCKVDFHQMR